MMINPLPNSSPAKGEVPIEAVLFDTYGTVCDFYLPMKRTFESLATAKFVECDAGRMAIDWRTAYLISTFTQAVEESEFIPLCEINRRNLVNLLAEHFPAEVVDTEIDAINSVWEHLAPWPEVIEGLSRIRRLAIIAPLSNGNFSDMVRLSRNAGLPWDIILGASISRFYKPHPDTYLKSVEALRLQPEQVCMVAAHQQDLAYAAGHGMQTAFVKRPDEFGGRIKPKNPEAGTSYIDAAEVFPEGNWTYLAEDFIDLAEQLTASV